jgi:long-chain acyl-CoA synthetase
MTMNGGSVVLGERVVAMADLLDRAARAATGLARQHNVGEGDSVAIMMRNDIAFLEASFAADFLGAYAVPINWHFKADEVRYILDDARARVLVIHADLLRQLDPSALGEVQILVAETPGEVAADYNLPPSVCPVPDGHMPWDVWLSEYVPWSKPPPAERASMLYTSGTTGKPKGVRREPLRAEHLEWSVTRQNLVASAPQKINLITGPMYHAAPNAHALAGVRAGGTVVIQPRFDAAEMLALVERHRVSHMHLVPTMFVRLLKLPEEVKMGHDLSSLEAVLHAAAPCPTEVKRRMLEWWGPIIHEYYGATEIGMVVYCDAENWLAHPGSVGTPLPGMTVEILDENRQPLPRGEIGEIFAHYAGFSEFTYQNREQDYLENKEGQLFSVGDIGYLDADNFLYICDRKSDMVISGGVNIYPTEIEAVILNHPGVRDCAVFGIPDDEFGEALAAVVEPMDTGILDAEAVRAHVRGHLAGYKVPKVVQFHASLPREDSGKIRKPVLRAAFWAEEERQI